MNYTNLKNWILASADCTQYVITPDMPKVSNPAPNDQAIADICMAQNWDTELYDHYITALSMMSKLGAITGATILEKLETASASNPVIKWAMYALKSDSGVNAGDPETQAMIESLVTASVLTQAEADAVKALGIRTIPVTAADVSTALRGGY